MELFFWIFLGITAGWITSILLGTHVTQGLLTDIILGAVGAIVGGLLLNLMGREGQGEFTIYHIAVASLGALVLIWFGRMVSITEE